ncbi:MAG: tandem-95 repeat protein [Candidatus Aenigmatarchaeota archaeon]
MKGGRGFGSSAMLGFVLALVLLSAGMAWALDAAPAVSLTASSASATTNVTLTAVAVDVLDNAGIQWIKLYENGAEIAIKNCGGMASCTFVHVVTKTASGVFSYTAKARDMGGNEANSQPATVTFNQAPVLGSIGDQTVNENELLEFAITATDANGDALTYAATGLPPGATFDPATRTFSWTPTYDQAGVYSNVTFTVSDWLESDDETITITVVDVNRDPVITSTPVTTGTENVLYTYDVDAMDPDGDAVMYALSVAPAGMTIDSASGLIEWTPDYEQAGDHNVTVEVTDGRSGVATQSWTIAVANVNRAPVWVEVPTDQVIDEDTALSYDVNATDPDGDALLYSLNDTSVFNIDEDGLITGTPPANWNGVMYLTITASDGDLSVSADIRVTVSPVNDAPSTTGIPGQTIAEDSGTTPVAIGGYFDDVDGDPLTFSILAENPAEVDCEIVGDVLEMTPSPDWNGAAACTVRADDGNGGTVDAPVDITVTPVNDAPVWASPIPDQNVDEDFGNAVVVADLNTLAFDVDGDTLEFSIVSENTAEVDCDIEGVRLEMNSVLNWNGVAGCTVRADDGNGGTADDSFYINVNPVNDAPVAEIASPPDFSTFEPGEMIDFMGTGADVEDGSLGGDSLVWTSSIDGNFGNGTSVSISTLSLGAHTITLTARDSGGATGEDVIYITIAVAPDTTPPVWSDEQVSPASPVTYSPSQLYRFEITWTDDVGMDGVQFELDGANHTPFNIGDEYYIEFIGLSAGMHTYAWHASDTSGNRNSTGPLSYEIYKAASACSLTFDLASPQTYGTPITATASCTNPEASAQLWRDGIDVTATENGVAVVLAAREHSYVANVSETANYLGASASGSFAVDKAASSVNLLLNGLDGDVTADRLSTVTITGEMAAGEADVEIREDGAIVGSGTAPVTVLKAYSVPRNYTITVVHPETENYTSSSESHTLTIVPIGGDTGWIYDSTVNGTFYESESTDIFANIDESVISDHSFINSENAGEFDVEVYIAGSTIVNSTITDLGGDGYPGEFDVYIVNCTIINSIKHDAHCVNSRIENSIDPRSRTEGSSITGTEYYNSNITNSNVSDSYIDWSSIDASNVDGSDIRNATISNAAVSDSTIALCNIADSSVSGATLTGCSISGGSIVTDSTFIDSNADNSAVDGSTLADSSATDSSVTDSMLEGTTVTNSDLTNIDSTDSTITDSTLSSLVLIGATVAGDVLYDGVVTDPVHGWTYNATGNAPLNLADPAAWPNVDVSHAPTSGINTRTSVTFTATISGQLYAAGTLVYAWDFDSDGTVDYVGVNDSVAEHTYASSGTYIAAVAVSDEFGSSAWETVTLVVKRAPSGGAWHGSSTAPSNGSASHTWVNVQPGVRYAMDIAASDIAWTSIAFSVNQTVDTVVIGVNRMYSIALPAAENAYQYIEANVTPVGLKDVEIAFRVVKSWIAQSGIEKGDIQQLRYVGGAWNEMATELVGEDDIYAYYKAASPWLEAGDFAYAIAAPKRPPAVLEPPEPTPEEPAQEEGVAVVNVSVMSGGQATSIPISATGLAVSRVDVTPSVRITDVLMSVRIVSEDYVQAIAKLLDGALQYFEITATSGGEPLADAGIDSVKITFKVSKSLIKERSVDAATIRLERWANGWSRLPTAKVAEDDEFVTYAAISPGFSLYAVASDPYIHPAFIAACAVVAVVVIAVALLAKFGNRFFRFGQMGKAPHV